MANFQVAEQIKYPQFEQIRHTVLAHVYKAEFTTMSKLFLPLFRI